MTPPDELTRRAEIEVAKELQPFAVIGMTPREARLYALCVRLMKYKQGVIEQAVLLYWGGHISIGKFTDLTGMDIYEARAYLKSRHTQEAG